MQLDHVRTPYIYRNTIFILVCAFFTQSCTLTDYVRNQLPARVPDQPAASYFHNMAMADSSTLSSELERLEAGRTNSLVSLIQRAIVLHHLENYGDALELLNVDHDQMPNCYGSRYCEDYRAFLLIFHELNDSRQQVADQGTNIRELQSRIESLQAQIDALTAIEQQILEREQRTDQ